jgi:hypothetical protein
MKSIKILLIMVLAILISAGAKAQNTFFPTKAGTVLIYADNDAKGKPKSHSKQTIKSVEGSGSNMTISYVMESLDKNRKPVSDPPMEVPCKVIIKNDVVFFDMNSFFTAQDPQFKVEFTGVPQELPNNLQPGQSIKDDDMTMTIDMGVMKMTTNMKMTDGKCLAIEDVTVPAGKYKAHKVTQTIATTAMKMETTAKVLTWYAPGVGVVKTEVYDSKNALTRTTALVEVTGR